MEAVSTPAATGFGSAGVKALAAAVESPTFVVPSSWDPGVSLGPSWGILVARLADLGVKLSVSVVFVFRRSLHII